MSKFGIQKGWSDQIWVGRLNKANTEFLDGKEDHTGLAINAVLELIVSKFGSEMEFTTDEKKYSVVVKVTEEGETNG